MVFENLLAKGEVQAVDNNSPVYEALLNGLEEMKRQYADRVILTLYECEPSKNATGRWLSSADSNYYPFEMLTEDEQRIILNEKSYSLTALVINNVGGIVKYEGDGVEKYHRTHVAPFLPALEKESELNYVTKGGIYTGDGLKEFAETAPDGWTPEAVKQRIQAGIQKYHAKTRDLIKGAGVHDTLERMEKRGCSPSEQILADMREKIASAGK